jgi:GWxTD domain-containing protein
MRYRYVCLLLGAAGILILQSAAGKNRPQSTENTKAFLCFQRSDTLAARGDTSGALAQLKRAVWHDRGFGAAYHRMGELYMAAGRVEDDVLARYSLKEALQLEPDNVDFLLTWMRFSVRTGALGSAKKAGEKILELDSLNIETYLTLGKIHEGDWFHFHDMISPQEKGILFRLAGEAEKEAIQALTYYQTALQTNPACAEALYRLALIHYERENLEEMAALMIRAVEAEPDNPDYHLFLGLAWHRMRRFEEAEAAYVRARETMEPEERAVFETVDLIAAPDRVPDFQKAAGEEKDRMTGRFWASKDPVLLTPLNERRLEHYGRIAYANLRYSIPRYGIRGWSTDRGRAYIRFGPPDFKFKTRPQYTEGISGSPLKGLGMIPKSVKEKSIGHAEVEGVIYQLHPGGKNPLKYSLQTWQYPDFSLNFMDYTFTGNYRHANTDIYKYILKKIPEQYRFLDPAQRIPLLASVACFRGEGGKTELEAYQSLPESEVWHLEKEGYYALQQGMFLFDADWNPVVNQVSVRKRLFSFQNSLLLFGWNRVRIKPGNYRMVVEYFSEEEDKLGRWEGEVEVPSISEDSLAVSSIVLARGIGNPEESGELRRGGMRIMPNTLGTYETGSLIPLYFEIYNLTFSPDGLTNYRITFTVEPVKEEGALKALAGRILGGDETGRIVTSYDYTGQSRDESVYQGLELEDPRPLKYRITVEVTDQNTGAAVSQTCQLVLSSESRVEE